MRCCNLNEIFSRKVKKIPNLSFFNWQQSIIMLIIHFTIKQQGYISFSHKMTAYKPNGLRLCVLVLRYKLNTAKRSKIFFNNCSLHFHNPFNLSHVHFAIFPTVTTQSHILLHDLKLQ
jgi:hypothetical protein